MLAALIGVNVYFLGYRGGTSIGALMRTSRVRAPAALAGKPAPAVAAAQPLPEDPPGARLREGVIADGQTVAQALAPQVGRRLAGQIEEVLGERFDLAAVHAGLAYALVLDGEDRLVTVELRASRDLLYRVDLSSHGPRLTELAGRAETRVVELVLPVGPSLWEALRRAGEGPALGERLVELFSGEGELAGAGAPPGERVRLVAEKRTIGGRFFRYGGVLAAEWWGRAGARRAFSFAGSEPGFYTERGEAVERAYRASPFRGLRGAAPGRRIVHLGDDGRVTIDAPAPGGSGAPIACAVTDGAVTWLQRTPTGGVVAIQTDDGGHVTYAHLGRLAPAVRIGQKVVRGQALGRVDGVLAITFDGPAAAIAAHLPAPRLPSLPTGERPRFGEAIAPLMERLRGLAVRPTDPLASRALSAIP